MNPTFSKTPISTIFIFALTATGVPDPQYESQTLRSRDQERSNSVEMITIVTRITGVLVAILTLTFMGYKHWKKSKRDLLVCFLYPISPPISRHFSLFSNLTMAQPLPTTSTSHAIPTKDDNDFFCIYFTLMYIAFTQSRDSRPTSYAPRPAFEIEQRSRDLERNLK
jgi:protein-S-isoprenylcysteine O-methyltransferase Ste14